MLLKFYLKYKDDPLNLDTDPILDGEVWASIDPQVKKEEYPRLATFAFKQKKNKKHYIVSISLNNSCIYENPLNKGK